MSHGQTVAKNAVWLMAATTAQKVIAFATFTLIARLSGVAVMGNYFYAVSISSMFVTLTDLGMTPVVIREMAADRTRGMATLLRALRTKLFLIPLAIFASLFYAMLTGSSRETLVAVALACFVMSADAISLVWYGVLRGERKLKYEAIGMFIGQLLTALASLVSILLFHAGVYGLVVSLFCGSFWNVVWSIAMARRMGIRLSIPAMRVRVLFLHALPFALAGLFVKVYSYVDTLLLKYFHDALAIGYYAVAYKITYAFQFLPLTFVAALYPGMSAAYASKERGELESMLMGSLRLMILVAAPLSALLSALAPLFIPVLYGKVYELSIAPLQVLAWVLIPIFLDFPIGSLLNATHRASLKTTAMGITMVVNAVSNFLLVPPLGPLGAAISGVISFWLMFLIGFWFARRDFLHFGSVLWLFARGGIVAFVLWFIGREYLVKFHFLTAAVLAAGLTILLLFVIQLVSAKDFHLFRRWIRPTALGLKEAHDEQ